MIWLRSLAGAKVASYIILLMILIGFFLQMTSQVFSQNNTCYSYQIYIPAVSDRGGEAVRTIIYIIEGGSGIYVVGVSSVATDTLISLFLSSILSSSVNKTFLENHRIYIIFPDDISIVRGPSAGALLTYLLIRSALGIGFNTSISGTGAINLDGSIEMVGGVKSKLNALSSIESVKTVFIPFSSYLYEGLESSYRGLRIVPVGNILDLFNLDVSNLSSYIFNDLKSNLFGSYEDYTTETLSLSVYTDIQRKYEEILYREYSRALNLARDLNLSMDRDLILAERVLKNLPEDPEYYYLRTNLLYIMATTLYQRELPILYYNQRSLFNSLYRDFTSSINRSLYISREALEDLDNRTIESYYLLNLYLILLDRIFDLISLVERNNYFSSQNPYNISELAIAYMRSLSISYWYDLFRSTRDLMMNSSTNFTPVLTLDLLSSKIKSLMESLNISRDSVSNETKMLLKTLGLENISENKIGLYEMLASLINIKNILEDYSFNLKYSTFIGIYSSVGFSGVEDVLREYNYINYTRSMVLEGRNATRLGLIYSMYFQAFVILEDPELVNSSLYISALRTLASLMSQDILLDILYGSLEVPKIIFLSKAFLPSECEEIYQTKTYKNLTSIIGYSESLRPLDLMRRIISIVVILVSFSLMLYFTRISRSRGL
ncbi:MAG: S16 family serine protease [Sulfolobales archaeon]